MTLYDLILHGKQGDDLGSILHAKGDVLADAMEAWAAELARAQATCLKLAQGLRDQHVTVNADGQIIHFSADDDEAEEALEKLVAAGLLSKEKAEDDEAAASAPPT